MAKNLSFFKTRHKSRVACWAFFWVALLLIGLEISFRAGYPYKFSFLEPYLLLRKNDDWTHNLFEIQRILNMEMTEYDEVYVYIGGSGALESISWDGQVEKMIAEDTGKTVRFISLCSSYKTFADEIKIINSLAQANVTFILGVEAWRFKVNPDIQLEYRDKENRYVKKYFHLAMPSGPLDFLVENGTPVSYKQILRLPHSAAYLGELLKKRLEEVVTKGEVRMRKHDRHATSRKKNKAYPKERITGAIRSLGENDSYKLNSDFNFQLLEQAVNLAHEQGNRVIIVDVPPNGALSSGFAAFAPDYAARIRSFAERNKIDYLEFSDNGPWKNEYYRDLHHMIKAGWSKFTPLLARRLAEELTE